MATTTQGTTDDSVREDVLSELSLLFYGQIMISLGS
jgi:hypothetical protein